MGLGFRQKQAVWKYLILAVSLLGIGSCSTNPATGEKQFTAFMSESDEADVGRSEHAKVEQTYGAFISGPVAAYVNRVGQKVAANTERGDVQYKFFVLDNPVVNAFALPGGYVYVSRGILSLANSEDELAGVLAHEIGHITARHAASRTSQGVLVGLGAAILSVATGSDAVGQVANMGSDLYIKSYSRRQEDQADELGVRYMANAGYDPKELSAFLTSLDRQTKLDKKIAGHTEDAELSYFSTHPLTADRVAHAAALAANYPAGQRSIERNAHMSVVNGMVYGDSEDQGFVRGDKFYHPKMGFTFDVPKGFTVENTPLELVATHPGGSAVILDSGRDNSGPSPVAYLTDVWMKDNKQNKAQSIEVNGMRAATAGFAGTANGAAVTIRVVVIEWKPGQFFRFQMAMPQSAGTDIAQGMKDMAYSFRRMSGSEMNGIKPLRIRTFTASAGQTIASAAASMQFPSYQQERFMVLNGLNAGDALVLGQVYKAVRE